MAVTRPRRVRAAIMAFAAPTVVAPPSSAFISVVLPRLNWPTTASWNRSAASRASSSLARFSAS
jgi:hypothetical protein